MQNPTSFASARRKAGTTWLFEQLNWHDDFWMPPLKEVNYFDQHEPLATSGTFRAQ